MADLAVMLEVLGAFFSGVRRICDWVFHVFAADGHFMFDFADHGVLRFAGSARLAAGNRDNHGKNS
jgi:hypothetical protein